MVNNTRTEFVKMIRALNISNRPRRRQRPFTAVVAFALLMMVVAASVACQRAPSSSTTSASHAGPTSPTREAGTSEAKRSVDGAAAGSAHSTPAASSDEAIPAGPISYPFSEAGSKITFVVTDPKREDGVERQVAIRKFHGVLVVRDQKIATATVTADLDMTSLDAGDPKLTDQLKTSRQLAVDKHPRATFVSTGVKQGGEGGATDTVIGTLRWRGVSRTVAIPATVHVHPKAVALDSEVKINPKAFGIATSGKSLGVPGGAIFLKLYIYANRAP